MTSRTVLGFFGQGSPGDPGGRLRNRRGGLRQVRHQPRQLVAQPCRVHRTHPLVELGQVEKPRVHGVLQPGGDGFPVRVRGPGPGRPCLLGQVGHQRRELSVGGRAPGGRDAGVPFGGFQLLVGGSGLDARDRLLAFGDARLRVQVADDGVEVRVRDGSVQQFLGADVRGRLDPPVGQRVGQPDERVFPVGGGDPQSRTGLSGLDGQVGDGRRQVLAHLGGLYDHQPPLVLGQI